jgi:hypothetical protein
MLYRHAGNKMIDDLHAILLKNVSQAPAATRCCSGGFVSAESAEFRNRNMAMGARPPRPPRPPDRDVLRCFDEMLDEFGGQLVLVGGLEHEFYFPIQLGISSSQLTNSYFSEG